MDGIITLAERRQRARDAMHAALPALDAGLIAYARANRGRFVRYGSSARGTMDVGSDVDLLVDFGAGEADRAAWLAAERLCHDLALRPDIRPLARSGDRLVSRALAEGVVLA